MKTFLGALAGATFLGLCFGSFYISDKEDCKMMCLGLLWYGAVCFFAGMVAIATKYDF